MKIHLWVVPKKKFGLVLYEDCGMRAKSGEDKLKVKVIEERSTVDRRHWGLNKG